MAWEKLTGFYGLAGTSAAERQALLDATPEHGWFLEIGSADGVTVAWLADRRPGVVFLSIDPYSTPRHVTADVYPQHLSNWWRNRRPNQLLLLGTSWDLSLTIEGFSPTGISGRWADVAFVDGSHNYEPCLRDLRHCACWVRQGGVIAAHDYGRRAGVTRAVDEAAALFDWDKLGVTGKTIFFRIGPIGPIGPIPSVRRAP